MNPSAWLLLGIVLLLGAGGTVPAVLVNIDQHRKAAASLTWPTTTGTVRSSRLDSQWVKARGYTFSARVRYAYSVAGVEYETGSIGFYDRNGEFGNDEAAAKAFVAKCAPGSSVTVHYDPQDPQSAVLNAGRAEMAWIPLVAFPALGIAFLVGAVACFVTWSHRRGR